MDISMKILNHFWAPMTMKTIIVFALAIATGIVRVLPITDGSSASSGWYVPQYNGTFLWLAEEDFQKLKNDTLSALISDLLSPKLKLSSEVYFYLYTAENPVESQNISMSDWSSVVLSNFDPANPTIFITHGWLGSAAGNPCYILRDAFLDSYDNCNVICVDWSDEADTIDYISASLHVPATGQKVASMIDYLNENFGMPFERLRLAGHSLGAHVSGFAGKYVRNGRINWIAGLDPAWPLFPYDEPNERLNANDAVYVESIQTTGGTLGYTEPIGEGAFYPNGGILQPGCGIDLSCSHSRSYEYYAEAVRYDDFPTRQCGSDKQAILSECGLGSTRVRMGAESNEANAYGIFYVPVNENPPYGKG